MMHSPVCVCNLRVHRHLRIFFSNFELIITSQVDWLSSSKSQIFLLQLRRTDWLHTWPLLSLMSCLITLFSLSMLTLPSFWNAQSNAFLLWESSSPSNTWQLGNTFLCIERFEPPTTMPSLRLRTTSFNHLNLADVTSWLLTNLPSEFFSCL